jgi:hypothetical protein
MDAKRAMAHATSSLQGRERREIELSCIHEIAKILTTTNALEQAATRVVGVLSESLRLREAMVVLFSKQGQPECAK